MATNHQISSNLHGRYQGVAKTKELYSQKHGHGNMRAGLKEENVSPRLQRHDGFKPVEDGRFHQSRDKIDGNGHRHGEIDRYDRSQSYNWREPLVRNSHNHDTGHFPHGKPNHGVSGMHGPFQGSVQYQFTQITVTHSAIFSGSHLGSFEKSSEAHKDFLNAALEYLKKPSEQAYKALNDSMIKLMDPRFAPAVNGGAAQVQIRSVNGTTMAKFTMEVTPAPTKSLDEAREDLKKAYSTKRDGEKDIAGIRAEAYANYVRALSEKFKKDGVISHTNHTPTTPVFKSSVIYVVKVTQLNLQSLHELKKPNFKNNFHGKLTVKNQPDFWNGYRKNHKSYVDMFRHGSKKSHIDKDFKSGKQPVDTKHHNHRLGENRTEKTGHNHPQKVRGHHI